MIKVKRKEQLISKHIDKKPDATLAIPGSIKLIRVFMSVAGRLFPTWTGKFAFRLFCTPMRRAKHKISDETLEKAQLFEVLFGSNLLKGYSWGEGEKIALLVHGWESRGTAMRSLVPTLLAKGYRVVTFDGPGHGASSGKRMNLVTYAQSIQAVINQVGQPEVIITHSFGGNATSYALSRYVLNHQVKKMVLITSPGRLKMMMDGYYQLVNLPLPAQKAMKNHMEEIVGHDLKLCSMHNLGEMVNIPEVLLIHDKNDKIVPFTEAEILHESWKQSHFVITEGFGHYRLMKNPDVIKRIGEFL